MKGCELCGCAARMYCEPDQASLCWDCDEKVHGANFLVAKHCRVLLCQVCESPTPWSASGHKLGRTVSICEACFSDVHGKSHGESSEGRQQSQGGNNDDEFGDDDEEEFSENYDDDEEEEEEDDEWDEEDGENQVVPWSVTSPVPPPAASSSSSEEVISSRFPCAGATVKRMRENDADFDSDDEIGCSSSQLSRGRLSNEEGISLASFRQLKQPRRSDVEDHGQAESGSTATIDSVKRRQRDVVTDRESASTSLGIRRLSTDQSR